MACGETGVPQTEYVLDNGGEDLVAVGFGIVEVFDGKVRLGVADDIESNGFGTLHYFDSPQPVEGVAIAE